MRPEGATARLPGYLAGLRRRGGRVLVVGTGGQRSVCRRLRGADDRDRRRVVLTPDGTGEGDAARLPCPAGESLEAVELRYPEDGALSLSRLARDTLVEIDRVATDDLDAAQLRVCVASLGALLEATDLGRTALFLDAVLDRTRAAGGLAHVHLDADYRSDPVRRLEPRFDAVIEVRDDPTTAQRWHVPDRDWVTEWVPVRD